ncbi:site-2 protease family protein [Cohnella pontilimi]|uniref:Site-2 protease family protein n=1 Tax=Cohnella pontilimi TaxID=2564100 RepID=A0A4U0FA64_9BACL|nr:site-2 protease family protein [Cohnella pontilimi]TJY41024.1 site-2 protease family protein [Cohnella pontilimi]
MSLQNGEETVEKKRRGNGGWAAGAGILVLLTKFKTALLFLLKAGKPLWTMILSVGAYALLFPWTFAVGFVLLIFIHEMGHVLAARRRGLPVTAPMFIPFLGAFISMKRNPKDAETEAYIAIGGPVLGSAGAFLCYAIGDWTGQPIWYALANAGFMINLLNLMPIHPLDGGRIVTAVSRWLWLIGGIAGPFIIWRFGGIIFIYIWLLFIWQMYKMFFRNRRKAEPYIVEGEYHAAVDPGLPSWYLAGESHRRELPFTAYCRLDGEHVVEFWWEPLSFKGELGLPQACLIDRVVLTKVSDPGETNEVKFRVRMEGSVYNPEKYYDVPLRVRIRMGLAYGGLIAALFYMIWKISETGMLQQPV